MGLYTSIVQKKQQKQKLFAVLIDPDKLALEDAEKMAALCMNAHVDFIFIGGSLLTENTFSNCVKAFKKYGSIPVVIFPGSTMQVCSSADALLFLSLISGRNADMLIGKHVIAAPIIKKTNVEVIPTGYMLIESGKLTSVMYMSNTIPIPADKDDIAYCTAIAGEMLGLKAIFLEAGSGAQCCVNTKIIEKVSNAINIPLIVGGGIDKPQKAIDICNAGADIIVVGNAIEKKQTLIKDISEAVHNL